MCEEVAVFRVYYHRTVAPNLTIQRYNPKIGKNEFVHCQLNTVPDDFWFCPAGGFVRDDFILERALEVIILEGYTIISVVGPVEMWCATSDEVSYQVVAQKKEG